MKGEPVEKFYGCLRELSLNCDLGSREESIIRDVFIANMQDGEIQRELLKETREPKKALEVAISIEMGIQTQLKISGTSTTNSTNEVHSINNVQGSWNRKRPSTNQFVKPTICPNCGYGWTPSHRQNCPARGKICKNCGISNHFAKFCRKPKQANKPRSRVNYVDDSISEAATVGTTTSVIQSKQVANIDQNQCPIKRQISFDFPELITRVGKSLKHSVKCTFHSEFTPTHQNGRRVPINLQPLVNIELKKLLDEKHIIKLNSCSDKNFISPIVITVKRDKTVKLALDSKILNKSIHKNEYQMPNIDNLIDTIQQNLNTSASQETAYYSTLDLKYAHRQLKLDPETARHCNFNIISGERTGTYRFITGFYGLIDMPAAFQKAMDYTSVGLKNTYCFLDDIIVVSRGSKEDHLKLVYQCLQKLDEDNLRINLPKCHFAKTEIEWLGHKFSNLE